MNIIFLTFILEIFLCLNSQAQGLKDKNNIEPKSIFEVNVNGKKYQISEDEELKIDALLKPTISIKLSEYKNFDNSSISFRYPGHLSFEFEQDFGYKNWTFSGNSLVVILFELDAKTSLTTLIDETVKKFGKENCVVEDFQKELGHRKWNSKKINVSLVGQKLELTYYEIILNDFKSRFIYFQDSMQDDMNSTEYKQGFNIIDSTLIFK